MSTETPYRMALALLLAGLVAHRAYFIRRFRGTSAMRPRGAPPGIAGLLIRTLGTAALMATIAYLVSPRAMSWAAIPLPSWVRWLGAATGLAGLLVIDAAQRALGVHWSIDARLIDGHQIVRAGPYRFVRHPIYTGFSMVLGSPFLIAANWAVGLTCLSVTLLDIGWRVRREEALLLSRFGSRYADYMSATGRFLPRLWRAGSASSGTSRS